jgi:hypothetical protein
MRLHELFSVAVATIQVADCAIIPIRTRPITRRGLAKRQHNGMMMQDPRAKMPWFNFVNETTPDATLDGKAGVLLEPDLIPGTRGIDGAMIRKSKRIKTRQMAFEN